MSSEEGKVHKLEAVKNGSDQESEAKDVREEAPAVTETHKDMSKVSMIVSLLAVLLLVIFFFGMNRNIAGLTDEVKSLGALRKDVSSLDERLGQMRTDMPVQMRRMIAHDMVNEMTMQAFYLTETLQDEALRTRMQDVLQGLKEIREELEK